MNNTQSSLFGEEKQFVSRNKKIIKSHGMKFYPPSKETPQGIINDLENIYHRSKFYSLTSGGKDSISLTHWLDGIGKLEAVVHIKTNIGLSSTTDFVIQLCKEQNWKLHIIEPSPKFTYAAHVLQYGFPGAGFHRLIMGKLKYKTMRDFALTIDRKNHCLISGIRKFESVRRMGNYPHPIQSDGALWFGCPFFYKSTEETYRYIHENGLKIAPAYSQGLGTSGECMCGSFAGNGEKELIRKLDPKLADYIKWLEEGIQKFGTKEAKRYPIWGNQAKISDLERQQQFDTFFTDNPDLLDVNSTESIVCGVECGAGTMRGHLITNGDTKMKLEFYVECVYYMPENPTPSVIVIIRNNIENLSSDPIFVDSPSDMKKIFSKLYEKETKTHKTSFIISLEKYQESKIMVGDKLTVDVEISEEIGQ